MLYLMIEFFCLLWAQCFIITQHSAIDYEPVDIQIPVFSPLGSVFFLKIINNIEQSFVSLQSLLSIPRQRVDVSSLGVIEIHQSIIIDAWILHHVSEIVQILYKKIPFRKIAEIFTNHEQTFYLPIFVKLTDVVCRNQTRHPLLPFLLWNITNWCWQSPDFHKKFSFFLILAWRHTLDIVFYHLKSGIVLYNICKMTRYVETCGIVAGTRRNIRNFLTDIFIIFPLRQIKDIVKNFYWILTWICLR